MTVHVILTNYIKPALIDEDDVAKIEQIGSWYEENGYAVSKLKYLDDDGQIAQKTLRMHRIIMDLEEGGIVDHINGDRLDNRKSNLRIVTAQQNAQNSAKPTSTTKIMTSKYKGVFMRKAKAHLAKPWNAEITLNDKKVHLGYFFTEIEAAHCYNHNAKKYYGEYARLNVFED